jgi:hypothetical protein
VDMHGARGVQSWVFVPGLFAILALRQRRIP